MIVRNHWLLRQLGFTPVSKQAPTCVDLPLSYYVLFVWWRITGQVQKGRKLP